MKKILSFVLVSLLLVSMTGCDSKEDYSDDSTSNKSTKNMKVYQCEEINDDDIELFFNYKNNKLVSVSLSYWNESDYLEEVKEMEREYDNISHKFIEDDGYERILVTMDLTKEGITLQESFGMFENTTDTSWKNIEKIVEDNYYTCSLED